jgi:lipopolysaccharide transport system ATP-binding protein
MSDIAVSVRGVSKSYTISHDKEKHTTLVGAILARLKDPLRRPERETFWALKDVSFDIKKGDVVGIIGRNGAGKSTLLKILSRITEPTTGEIHVFGRIGSLLEVGTGFHPELTGRENVFLNGAILGMSKAEIRKQFDAIVDFAGVEKFLDTPVKRYSSGMYVRLAFAVAAHLNPEILIVDEVLAVGDAEFQKKCLGKMKDVSSQGRTVIFVSHNMTAVGQLCSEAIMLRAGRIVVTGPVDEVIPRYFEINADVQSPVWRRTTEVFDAEFLVPTRIAVVDDENQPVKGPLRNDKCYWVELDVTVNSLSPLLEIGYGLLTSEGLLVLWSFHTDGSADTWPRLKLGHNRLRSPWPRNYLNEGSYRIEFLAALHNQKWILESGVNAPQISVSVQGGLSNSPHFNHKRLGLMAPVFDWATAE